MGASFRRLAERLGELSTVPSRCSAKVAEKVGKLIDQQFQQGQDPYGDAWEPLAVATVDRGRRPPPLTDTGRMRDEVRVKALRGAGIEITMLTPYAHFHQSGTKWMPSRSLLPDGSELPDEWQDAIESSLRDAIRGK